MKELLAYISIILTIAGAVLFYFCRNEKQAELKELGRIMFFVGLSAILWFAK